MNQPIFILSCPRSGSTLLRYVLDTHPAVYAPPELNLGALANTLAVTHAGFNGQLPSIPPTGALSPEVRAAVGDDISRMMAEQARRRGKSTWCEKAPPNMGHLDLLLSLYPEARYICLYRNHLDTIDSCIEISRYSCLPPIIEYVSRHSGSLLRATADYWIDVTSRLIALERASDFRTHRLRYEDMVKDPGEALAGLFSFLELDWQPGLLDAVYTTPHDVGLGDTLVRFHGRINPGSIGRGRALPTGLLMESQRARVKELNRELGYVELIEEILTVPIPAPSPAAVAGEEGPPPSHAERGPRWLFEEHLPPRLKDCREAHPLLGRSYRFAISGEGGGCWLLRHDGNGGMEVLEGQAESSEAVTTLGLDASDLLGIVEGRLHVLKLQRAGRINFSGPPPTLEQIESLITLLRGER